ncbi:MAG: hypothetical protein KJ065_18590 [Anaerolineae bacterium]|nr:hypothetical protein [Anaerolineae bacterium]
MLKAADKATIYGDILGNGRSVPALVTYEYSRDSPGAVSVSVIPERDSFIDPWIRSRGSDSLISVRTKDRGKTGCIWFPSINITQSISGAPHPDQFDGFAELMIEGNLTIPREGQRLVYLYLPHTNLIQLTEDTSPENREIKLHREDELTGIAWEMSIGQAELVRTYHYYQDVLGRNKARMEVQIPAIRLEVDESLDISIEELISRIWQEDHETEFDEVCWLLSILSGNRMMWDHGHIRFPEMREGDLSERFPVELRRAVEAPPQNSPQTTPYPLVSPDMLRNGVFNRMVSKFKGLRSHEREKLLEVVRILHATYETNYLDVQYGLLWTTFEMFINEFAGETERNMLTEEQLRSLRSILENTIRQNFEGDAQTELRKDLYAKIGEFRRRPLQGKIERIAGKFKIDMTQFWPKDAVVSDELNNMIQRRNSYIHQGRFTDEFSERWKDVGRIRYWLIYWSLLLLDFPTEDLKTRFNEDRYRATS